jgi:hypothetical protein
MSVSKGGADSENETSDSQLSSVADDDSDFDDVRNCVCVCAHTHAHYRVCRLCLSVCMCAGAWMRGCVRPFTGRDAAERWPQRSPPRRVKR